MNYVPVRHFRVPIAGLPARAALKYGTGKVNKNNKRLLKRSNLFLTKNIFIP